MAYIHVKRIGNKKYYSLRISVRKGDKVITKDLCNLGDDLSKISLNSLEKRHKQEIRKSYKTIKKFLDSNRYIEKIRKLKIKSSPHYTKEQLINIEAIRTHYNSKFMKSDKLIQKESIESFLINFAVNSTSIEGNTITLKEANRLFREDIVPKDKTFREVHDLTNTKRTIEFLNNKKPRINVDLAVQIHDMLLKNIDERRGFRNHDIHIFGQPFKPTPARYIKIDLKLLFEWYFKNRIKLHPLALVTFFHHKFENIHPFSDGNGRTGRVLMNYILPSFGYPPFVISRRFRKEYLDSMNKADSSLKKGLTQVEMKHYQSLIKFIYSQFKTSYWDTFLI